MILAMIARVSLGHTGRPLTVNLWISLGFGCLCLSYLARVWLPLFNMELSLVWGFLISIVLWVIGYGLFVIVYLPILTRPRIDGRPG